jgi:mannose-6-phosphate isomerase-like protein (cupin superfamily)
MSTDITDYQVVTPDDTKNSYAGSDVPGEWYSLTDALGAEQVSMSYVRVPAHCDFDQGTGHHHEETEEIYLVTRGTLTMRFGDEIRHVSAPAAVRVAAQTARAVYRNEGDEPAEAWAISRKHGGHDATKLDHFWEASPEAAQRR